jgi:small-conductance mechanosensitive channel
VWLDGTTLSFDLWRPILDAVSAVLAFRFSVGALDISIGGVIVFIIAIVLTVFFSRFVRFVLAVDVFPRLKLPRGVGDSTSKIVHYTVLAVGIMVALAAAGINMQSFALVAGALGIGIGFGLQNLVNNFVSGLVLIFERPIGVGDTIDFGQRRGVVKRIGMRSSTVRTFDGAEVIVPNGNLVSAEVVNWTLSDRMRRMDLPVGVAYGTDPQTVIDLLVGVARDNPRVATHPEPYALFLGFGDSSLDFELRSWTAEFDDWLWIASEIAVTVNTALAEAGIEIPFPQRDLHLKSIDNSVKGEIALGEGKEQA